MDQKSELTLQQTPKNQENLTRRDILKIGIGLGAWHVSRKLGSFEQNQATAEPLNQEIDAELLQKQIEEKYNVKFSLREDMENPWQADWLLNMAAFLENIPGHFYKPDEQGRVVNFELNKTNSNYCCGYSDTELKVAVTTRAVYLEEAAAINVGHELTHRIAEVPIFHEDGGVTFENPNPFVTKVEGILGQSLSDTPSLLEQFKQATENLQGVKDGSLLWSFLRIYPYAAEHSGEFIPVMTEQYVLGEEHFLRMYGMIFPDQAEELYNFMKEEIFRGVSYEDLSLVEKMKASNK